MARKEITVSEVTRHLAGDIYEGAEVVYATDFDRVTAERDALRNEVGQVKCEYDRAVNKVDALQQRLTAADERADALEGRVSMLIRELKELINDDDGILVAAELSTGFVWNVLQKHGKAIQAALKPAEAKRNQCDGCQAGIPVVNGAHRMGKPGGYPDTMSCTAKLYRPVEGGGDEK